MRVYRAYRLIAAIVFIGCRAFGKDVDSSTSSCEQGVCVCVCVCVCAPRVVTQPEGQQFI